MAFRTPQERFQWVRRHLGGDMAPIYSGVDHFAFEPTPDYEGHAYLGMQIFKCRSKLGHRIQTVQMSAAASAETDTITEAQIAASTIRSRRCRLSSRGLSRDPSRSGARLRAGGKRRRWWPWPIGNRDGFSSLPPWPTKRQPSPCPARAGLIFPHACPRCDAFV